MVVGAGVIALVLRGGDRSEPSELARPADEPAVAVDVERQPEAGSSESGQREPATFAQKPTFTQPIEAIVLDEWISACAVIPETLRHIAARVHVSPEPAEAVYREWGDAVETASRAWLRLDEPLQQDILNALRSVLEECSDRPAVSDRLLGELSIPEARIDEPIDLSRRLWRVRVLVELTQSIRLSLAVRERCELHLRAAMPDFDSVTNQGVDEVMAKMLRSTLPALTSALQRDGDVYALWEVWLHSVGRFVDVNDHNKLRLDGIEAVLASQHDLVTPGPAANVLGRLIDEIDWREAPEAKSRLAEWCHSTSNITSEDLWILTSLLSERESMAWLLPQFIVPRSADESHRRRVRDQMAAAWPTVVEQLAVAAPAGRGVDVDPQLASQWRELQRTVLAERLVQQQEALASQLAILARLNEAASLLEQGETVAADEVMQWIEQVRASGSIFDGVSRLSSPRGPFGSGIHRAPGQAIGQDGVWAQAYQQIGTNAEERIKLLRALRSTAGTDLGPTDAATFVREVYRATPLEVRTMAQSIAMEFRLGPIVAQHMLDQLPDAVHNEGTSEFLGRFIGRSLPPVRSERWKIEARLLMTEHCLSLLDSMEVTIDRAADIIADAVASQGPTVDRELVLRARGLSPAEAAELVRTSWYESARNVVAAEPVPSDVATLDRRHRSRKALAIGPIQSFVASRLGHMELFAFLVSAEQPGLRVTLSSLLTASSDRRAQMTDALQQAIEIERVMAQLHSLRMQQTAATMEVYP